MIRREDDGVWRPVLLSFLTARLIVLTALLASRIVTAFGHRGETLLGWDAMWYRLIAERGYAGSPPEALRFFPLLPLLTRGLGFVLRSDGAALLVIANGCALGYAWLGHRLALSVGLSPQAARLVPWVIALLPTGFVLVMGYSEALFGILITATLLAGRSRQWWLAALAAAGAGALRPTGVLLGLPLFIEALRGLPHVRARDWIARAVAVVSPAAGLGAYLLWVRARFGDGLLPFQVQTRSDLRAGVLVDTLPDLGQAFDALGHAVTGHATGSVAPLVHLCWAVLVVIVLVACARQQPPSFTAFSAATVFLALTARNLNSFERYAGSAVPLLLVVAAWLTHRTPAQRTRIAGLAGVVLFGYSLAAFTHSYIP